MNNQKIEYKRKDGVRKYWRGNERFDICMI